MFSGIDAIMLFVSAVLLGVAMVSAWFALRRQKELEAMTEAALTAQLQEWRSHGLLIIDDNVFGLMPELEKDHPEQLRYVTITARRIFDEAERESIPIRVLLTVNYDDKIENALKESGEGGASKRTLQGPHLELVTHFA